MAIGVPDVEVADLDLRRFLQSGDRVVVSQGAAEPLPLVKALVAQGETLPDLGVFMGLSYSGLFTPELARSVQLSSFGAMGTLRTVAAEGLLDVIPCNYSDLPWLVREGPWRATAVLAQVSPPDSGGYHSFGISVDYVAEAVNHARVVIAEVNDQMPITAGSLRIHQSRITAAIHTSRSLITVPLDQPSDIDEAIAQRVADLVPDRATVQLGIGSVPVAVGRLLVGRRGLRVHSGLVGDWLLDLVSAGALEQIPHGRPVAVTGAAMGTEALYAFAGACPGLVFEPISVVNSTEVLGEIEQLMAINSALQVDLSGQVNAEMVGSRYVASIGGQTDFLRAAHVGRGGRAIVALNSTARGGSLSRIVVELDSGRVTTPQSYVDYVVTEYGVASLRGRSIRERAEALVSVAAPQFRDELADAMATMGRGVNANQNETT